MRNAAPRLALAAALCAVLVAPVPAAAQSETPEDEGPSLMERGADLFMRGLRGEVEPTLRDLGDMAGAFGPAMRSFAEEMGPALTDLLDRVKDFSAYDAPEIQPNGDILIRRKPDADPLPPEAFAPKDDDIEI